MRIFLRRPSHEKLVALAKTYQDVAVTCAQPGATRAWTSSMFEQLPDSRMVGDELWKFRRESLSIGEGKFDRAVDALLNAQCFDLSWVTCIADRPFEEGDTFCLSVKAFGVWAINFCRIIYVNDVQNDDQQERMVSIGIATLPVHAAIGEERLSVTINRTTKRVDFLIGSYSKPSSLLSRLFARYLRKRQDVFAVDATERMKQAIGE